MNDDLLLIDNPSDFLMLFDPDISSGKYDIYNWQRNVHKDIADPNVTAENPCKLSIAAVNGSGKDKVLIAPSALWLACRYYDTDVVITSASAKQINNQTKPYIKRLLENVNKTIGGEYVVYKEDVITIPSARSNIYCFATDDPGLAEGYHPKVPGAKLMIIVNEAKTVIEGIFQAFYRCTGFTHRIDISSPGLRRGHFFQTHNAEIWKNYDITAFDCPHLGKSFADDVAVNYGLGSSLYRSMVDCQFGADDQQIVIGDKSLDSCISANIEHRPDHNKITAGLDFSAGKDETVVAIRNGNKILDLIYFRYNSTSIAISTIEQILHKNNVSVLNGDAGGLGKPILDELVRRGWQNVNYFYNNGKAYDTLAYADLGTEIWFNLAHLIEDKLIIFPSPVDKKLKEQLTTRVFFGVDGEKVKLEPKKKMPKSPDRADAIVLCFANYSHRIYGSTFKVATPTPEMLGAHKPLERQSIIDMDHMNIVNYRKGALNFKSRAVSPVLQERVDFINAMINAGKGDHLFTATIQK